MSDDEEIEEFKITDWDLENEFNINRVRYKQTREDRIYGVWAERSDRNDDQDDPEERPTMGRNKNRGGNYSGGISFVQGGTTASSSKDDGDDDDEIEVRMPRKKNRAQAAGAFAGDRTVLGSAIGSWEKHTKGIGAKLLLQMGYQPGKGLGKNLQGISAPVEATVRKGKGAIGSHGPERPAQVIPVDDLEVKQKREANQWRKGEKKIKYVYKSLEEVQKEGSTFFERDRQGAKQKVIDMTGPEQRILTGYHQISQQHHRPEDEVKGPQGNFSLPELDENLEVLISSCENDIKRNTQKIENEKNRLTNLTFELGRIEVEKKEVETVEERLKKVYDFLRFFEDHCDPKKKSYAGIEEILARYKKLYHSFEDDFYQFELNDLAPLVVVPCMKAHMTDWDPMENPRLGVELFREWKSLLHETNRSDQQNHYRLLLWEVWCPPVRRAVLEWSPKEPERLIVLLEVWRSALTDYVFDHLVEQFILPRLQKEVDDWDPLSDTVPIHTWIHPWLPFIAEHLLERCYQIIRMKLAQALTSWHPSDGSAKLILEPWVGVMPKGSLEAFVVTNVIPKLGIVLQNFVIDPRNQEFESWQWFTAWGDIAPPAALVAILEKYFFPQFHQILYEWLQSARNYDDIATWFAGWKAAFPDKVNQDVRVRDQFRMAMEMMNRALSGQPFHPMRVKEAYQQPTPPTVPVQQQARERFTATSATSANYTFKETLERRASDKGILLTPVPNNNVDGRTVYKLGTHHLYLDRNVIFVFNGKIWVPTSMESLLDTC